MTVSVVLAGIVAAVFAGLGVAKVLALAPMRVRAARVDFSTDAYRRIGALEIAGAAGVALGPRLPLLGGLAAVGLLALLAGALITHLRHGDGISDMAPAVVCVLLVAVYLTVLIGATS